MTAQEARTHIRYSGWASRKVLEAAAAADPAFPQQRALVRNLYLGAPRIAVSRDRIVFNLGEHGGNVWLTDLPLGDRR